MNKGLRIRVTGVVQGVGFRPSVWHHARDCGIQGDVCNDSQGVLIHAWGSDAALHAFCQRIQNQAPPLARVEHLRCSEWNEAPQTVGFRIISSHAGNAQTEIAADAATCAACLAEILDPDNRRYRYPFTNCTHCGPRLSIIRKIPYDRAHTSMSQFRMCKRCQAEYDDPGNRRFHAQPNACPDCGPKLWLEGHQGKPYANLPGADAICTAAHLLKQGAIVAIKGIGGVHLACDASNTEAVARLRKRKHRDRKAFALMAADLQMVEEYAQLSKLESSLLQDQAAPIVLLSAQGRKLPQNIAPAQHSLGFMLPYSPLHHLLMTHMNAPIVLTSGNHSDEPQVISNTEARQRLTQIADFLLLHDRDIVNRLDDSVLRVIDKQSRIMRRARGYAPGSVALPPGFEESDRILALGAELKQTFCLIKSARAIVSQHIGDLEDMRTLHSARQQLHLYQQLFDFEAQTVVIDRHPDYLSSQWGHMLAQQHELRLIEVQHHHAHLAACMVEHGFERHSTAMLGIALDGLGYGDDGELWWGEFLLADYLGYRRLAHFQAVPLLGGKVAMREPWRNLLAHLWSLPDQQRVFERYSHLNCMRLIGQKNLSVLRRMFDTQLNSPPASSAGRLFDAVAAAIGINPERITYEGQAAMELESLARAAMSAQKNAAYGYRLHNNVIDWEPLWWMLLDDLHKGTDAAIIAARFHHGLAAAIAETAASLCTRQGMDKVLLSGGVWQNRLLLEQTTSLLCKTGLQVFSHRHFPANDGAISLGQAAIAAAVIQE